MTGEDRPNSRVHDLLGTALGLMALGLLLSSPWQVDTSGPDPFYKGPLIFPLLVLILLLGASLPSMYRILRPPAGSSWELDGRGLPYQGMMVLGLLILFLVGQVYLGLEIATWLFLFLALWLLRQRTPGKLLGLPSAVTAVIHLVFIVFLDVWFPTPILFAILSG